MAKAPKGFYWVQFKGGGGRKWSAHKSNALALREAETPDPDPAVYVENVIRWDGARCSWDGRRWAIRGGDSYLYSGEDLGPYAPLPKGAYSMKLQRALLAFGASWHEAIRVSDEYSPPSGTQGRCPWAPEGS